MVAGIGVTASVLAANPRVDDLHRRALALRANPESDDKIADLAEEIRQLRREALPLKQQRLINEAFDFLAEAHQRLEYQRDESNPPAYEAPRLRQITGHPETSPEEPPLTERIWQAITKAFKAMIQFFKKYLCCCLISEKPAAPDQRRVVSQRQVTNLEAVGGPAVAENCVREMLVRLWDAVESGEDLSDVRKAELIDASLRKGASKRDFPRIESFRLIDLGDAQDYESKMKALIFRARANEPKMIAAILAKGEERHLILVDARNLAKYNFYHYDPQGAADLKICDNSHAFVDHLNETVPIQQSVPFTMTALKVKAAT